MVLDEVKYRVEWAKFQERERQKEEEAKEKERGQYWVTGSSETVFKPVMRYVSKL